MAIVVQIARLLKYNSSRGIFAVFDERMLS